KTGKIAEAITTNQKTGKIAEAITTNQKIGKIAEAITTNPAPTNQKITVGYLDQAKIENGKAIVKGWAGSMGGGPLKGFKISIGGNNIAEFQPALNLPSPDVAKKHPHLDNSGAARFRVVIPLPPNQLQEYQDSLLALTPIFETGEGQIMTKVLDSAGNKSLGYEIVSEGGSEKVLFNGKLLPIPPKTLRNRVHGSGDLHDFLSKGLGINRDLKAALKRIGKDWNQFETVLDLGCGCGRVMMWNAAEENAAKIYGNDIDPAAIHWCEEHLNLGNFGINKALPPLEYEENKFDLIYLVSVFTHINEEMQFKWLEEFKRIVKPEGIVVITISSGPKNPQQAAKLAGELEEKGIVFVKTHGAKDSVFPAWYQTTYLSEGYLRDKWANYLDVVDYIPGGIRGNQDV
ncbi:MAG: class I SAM-dependent methyltransferase, partial [Cyanobacteriota bacterium]|nr:class I SAM-dependent methyltransferase [Cyanobacteriota bacterium]